VSQRVHYIDWLRVLAVLLLFPFHTLRVFNAPISPGDAAFYVKSAATSLPVSYLLWFIDRWHMPLLFLLAGASTLLAFRTRTPGQYARERVNRLLWPFGVGLLVLIPPQTWIGAIRNSGYTGDFFHYLVSGDFLVWNIRNGGDYYGGFGVGHLWFILWLFAVSMMALPLLAWSRSERGGEWIRLWGQRLSRPVWWLLPPLLILIGDALPDVAGKNPFYYLAFFVIGAVAFSDPSFGETAAQVWSGALVLGVLLTAGYVGTWQLRSGIVDPSLESAIVNYFAFLGTWLLLVGLLGAGKRWLDRPSATLSYLSEASYPVYILHQTVIVILAVPVLGLPIPWPAHAVVLLAGSVLVTFALYEGARRVGVLRDVLGMKPAPTSAGTAPPVS
jgi:surface polysaccharide O-acyltransferase-like enzyme